MSTQLHKDIYLIENLEGCNMLRRFGHLMNQYSAGYYGYLFSEVLSADMFHSRFAVEGILNRKVGEEYRETVGALKYYVLLSLGSCSMMYLQWVTPSIGPRARWHWKDFGTPHQVPWPCARPRALPALTRH